MLRSMSSFAKTPVRSIRRALLCVAFTAALAANAPVQAEAQGQPPPQPPQPQDGFVPVGDAPVQEQLPAAPLLIAAYIVVLGGLFVYVVSLSRRLGTVRRDVERLEGDLKRRGRA